MAARLESRAEVAAGLHGRLELTERAQSTLADERCQALRNLEEKRERRDLWPNGGAKTSAWSWRCSGEHENPQGPRFCRPPPRPLQRCRWPQGAGAGVTGRGGVGCSGVNDEEQQEREAVHSGWREARTLENVEEQEGLADRYAERNSGTVDRSEAAMARDEVLKILWRSMERHSATP